ncbi:MAG: ABC transporter permease [Firmicutes bacterium]|nr:ABC transporter permease [Bacillota bacterium]
MEGIISLWGFFVDRSGTILDLGVEHAFLVLASVIIAVLLGVLAGIAITYYRPVAQIVLYICQVMMTVPSLATFGLLLPIFGIGFKTGVVALVLYSLLPIVRNTYTGIREIDDSVLQAAKGMGMGGWTVLLKVKLPLALPVIMAGIRTATVMVVGIGAIASYIGAGGLGELIFRGISRYNKDMILAGAVVVSLMALTADYLLRVAENRYNTK